MKYHHRDLIEVPFTLPDGKIKNHPAIIISVDAVYQHEEFYHCVMCSTKKYGWDFEFELTPGMFTHQTATTSYVKCQLISTFYEDEIIQRIGSVKIQSFNNLIEHLKTTVLGV